jgi:hypothetical protein
MKCTADLHVALCSLTSTKRNNTSCLLSSLQGRLRVNDITILNLTYSVP